MTSIINKNNLFEQQQNFNMTLSLYKKQLFGDTGDFTILKPFLNFKNNFFYEIFIVFLYINLNQCKLINIFF